MPKKTFVLTGLFLLLVSTGVAQKQSGQEGIKCRVMEVFMAERLGVRVAIFHQRDKADGPRLGELLQAHTGQETEFETSDGERHGALVVRMESCFGRGLLLFAARDAKLAAKEDFVLRFPEKR